MDTGSRSVGRAAVPGTSVWTLRYGGRTTREALMESVLIVTAAVVVLSCAVAAGLVDE